MGLSVWQILIVAVVILVLFGRGRISEMMGDFGKGIKSFKQGMDDETVNRQPQQPPAQISAPSASQPQDQQATLNGEATVDSNQSGQR